MAYTPTGKRVGRPKTKDYQTISLKIPQELLDRVQVYARLHRQSLSELMRDGVEWRITEGALRGLGVYAPQRTKSHEDEYYGNTVIPAEVRGEPEHAGILHEIRTALARQETQLRELAQALEHRPVALAPRAYSGKTRNGPSEQLSPLEPAPEGDGRHTPQKVHTEDSNTVLQKDIPAFDPTKYALGKLCPRRHDHQGTGQSLLRISNRHCMLCDREKWHEKYSPQRQAKPKPPPQRQPVNEPSGCEARPAETADTPGEDTPVARRRALLLAAVPWEADTPTGVSPATIRAATGLSKTQVANDLRDLGKRGEVVKMDKGQYVRTAPMSAAPQGEAEGTRARRQAKPPAPP